MEGNAPLPKENLIILFLLKKNTLILVGFVCQVNHSLDPELDMPVVEFLGFLTTNAIKYHTTLWIQFYLRCTSEGPRNFEVHVLMGLHQITFVSLP